MVQGSSHARLTMNHVAHCQWLHMGTVPTRVASTGTALRGGCRCFLGFYGDDRSQHETYRNISPQILFYLNQ